MKEKIFHLGVKALIQKSSGHILLLKGNPEKFKNSYWDVPGGRVLNGHTVEETLFREIEEETGITALHSFDPLEMLISNIEIPLQDDHKIGLVLSIYKCIINEPIQIKLSGEHSEYAWFSPEEASRLLSYKYPPAFTDTLRSM